MKTDQQEWNVGQSQQGIHYDAVAAPAAVSPAMNQLAASLAAAQVEMKNPGFDAANPHFRNKFASLAAVRNAVVPVLAKHGISLTQDITTVDGGIACRTILTHASGQQMVFGPLVLPPTKADAQGFGSAATYARRYSMMAVAAVVGDEDDDGNGASDSNKEAAKLNTKAAEYADLFMLAIESGIDGRIVELNQELGNDNALKMAIWTRLEAPVRRKIKDVIAAAEREIP